MTRSPLLAPSLLAADLMNVEQSISSLGGQHDWLHVDVMDGCFVPNITFGPAFVRGLRKRYPEETLDVHLMVEHPDHLLDDFLGAGADILTVHVEADRHVHRTLSRIRESGAKAGLSLNPGTSVELLRPLLPFVDLILVMSVNPGFGGQKFIETVMEKTTALCRWRSAGHFSYLVEMDGGIGRENAADVVRGGCDVLVMGSAVFGAPNPADMLKAVRSDLVEVMPHV